jgi:hypothetical protein
MRNTLRLLLLASVFMASAVAYGQQSRFVTICTTNDLNVIPTIQVLTGETAEILSCVNQSGNVLSVPFQKNGFIYKAYPPGYPSGVNLGSSVPFLLLPRGTVLVGPASISLDSPNSYLTVQITPDAYDVNKTLILPPSTNQFFVTLETSTNLVSWCDATNGIYGSPDLARFFRIRMQKQP